MWMPRTKTNINANKADNIASNCDEIEICFTIFNLHGKKTVQKNCSSKEEI